MIKALIRMTVHSAITESDTLGGGKKPHPTSWEERKGKKPLRFTGNQSTGRESPQPAAGKPQGSPPLLNRPKLAASSSPAMDKICQILLNSECRGLVSDGKGSLGDCGKPVAVGFLGCPGAGSSARHGSYGKGDVSLEDLISLGGTWEPEAFIKLF